MPSAENGSPHCSTCTCGCTCGYGGFHEPENERCELNARVLPPAESAFSCRHCDYTSDEYGDTHTHEGGRDD